MRLCMETGRVRPVKFPHPDGATPGAIRSAIVEMGTDPPERSMEVPGERPGPRSRSGIGFMGTVSFMPATDFRSSRKDPVSTARAREQVVAAKRTGIARCGDIHALPLVILREGARYERDSIM